LATILLLLTAAVGMAATQEAEERRLQQLGQEYLDKTFEYFPVYATEMGNYDPESLRYPDLSRKALNDYESVIKDLRRDLGRIRRESISVDAKIDYMLLESNLRSQLLYLERTPLIRNNPKEFSANAINGIYLLLNSPSLSDSTKLEFILERLSDLPRFLGSAREILDEPPRLWLVLAEAEADNGIEFLAQTADYFSRRFPARNYEIQQQFGQAADALERFVDLADALELTEYSSYELGKENFDELLELRFFLDIDSDSLLKLGESLFTDALIMYDSAEAIVDSLPAEESRDYFVPESFGRDDVLDYYRWEINQSRIWVQHSGFASVPREIGKCVPVETPEFLANIVGGAAYQPAGPFEYVQQGYFYVNPLPDSLDAASRSAYFKYCMQRGFRRLTVHEAYPGHHFQIQMANRHPSLIRRIQRNPLMMEGWSLYCEEAVYHHGFYDDDPRAYLNILGGIVFRAARIIVDVKLHTGQFTYQDAVGWMVENLGYSLEYLESEVSRYTLTPTQPMSYLIGKLKIEDLHELYQSQHPEDYSVENFHDMLLSEGSISPELIRRKLTGEIR
jgi:uncharacterized protein (DUF885 family)